MQIIYHFEDLREPDNISRVLCCNSPLFGSKMVEKSQPSLENMLKLWRVSSETKGTSLKPLGCWVEWCLDPPEIASELVGKHWKQSWGVISSNNALMTLLSAGRTRCDRWFRQCYTCSQCRQTMAEGGSVGLIRGKEREKRGSWREKERKVHEFGLKVTAQPMGTKGKISSLKNFRGKSPKIPLKCPRKIPKNP